MKDSDLQAFAAGIGIPGLFDVHVHFMHPRVMAKVWAYFDGAGSLPAGLWPVQYRGTDEERVENLRSMGVRRFTSLSYAHKPDMAGFLNDWTRDFAARTPDTLWSATFYPEPAAEAYVSALIDEGVQVFKVHLQVGDFAADDPLLEPVWGTLAESRTPVVIHAGSGPAPGTYTGPGGVASVLARHPRLRLVIAHLGMPETKEFMDLAEGYPEVMLDTTMAFVDYWKQSPDPAIVGRLTGLQDRILFGTDFPNIPYDYAHQVDALQRLDLGDDWMRDVLWNNGVRVFATGDEVVA